MGEYTRCTHVSAVSPRDMPLPCGRAHVTIAADERSMIEVRTPTEAAAYALLTGHAVLDRRRPRPNVEVWTCVWQDQRKDLTFVFRPDAAPAVTPAQFGQVARALLATLPDGPQGFVRGAIRRMFDDALLAGACLDAAEPGPAVDTLHEVARARRAAMAAALPTAPDAGPIDALPVPPHGFRPLPADAAWLAAAAPLPLAELPEPWHVVARGPDGRYLLRHPAHALAWATVDTERRQILRLDGLTGADALTALITHGFRLEEVQLARLRAAAQPPDGGAPPLLDEVLARGLPAGRARAILELRHPSHRARFVEVETRVPRYKAALVVFLLDDDDRVIGLRPVDGVDGYAMMNLADAIAPTLPGADGSPPEAARMAEADANARRIAAAVVPVIEAMLRGPDGVEAVRPREADAAWVFAPGTAEDAHRRYAALWQQDPPRLPRPAGPVTLQLGVCPAGFLGTDNPLAAPFPAAYAQVAERLNPHAVWVCWAYDDGRARGDGLVWVPEGAGGRWVWFPKPWRVLT